MTEVTLSDEFDHPQGRFVNYDTYNANDRLTLAGQKHVDIRSFSNAPRRTEWRMIDFNQTQVGELSNLTMGAFQGTRIYRAGEQWSAGVVGRHADRNNWPGLTLECAPGENSTQSVIAYTLDEEDGDQHTNRLTNPSFETGVGNWIANGTGVTRAVSTGWASSGKQSLRVTGSQAGVNSAGVYHANIPVTAGETISVAGDVNIIANQSTGLRMSVEWKQDDNSSAATTIFTAWRTGVGVHRFTLTGVVPANATKITVTFYSSGTDGPIDFYLDSVIVREGSDPTYFDGDQPRYKWTGIAHASTSTGPFMVEAERVDLITDFNDDDYISLALPDFPLSAVNTAASFLDLTANESGDFAAGPTTSVALSDSVLPLVEGDSEFRATRDDYDNVDIDLGTVTGVRLRITATDYCTVKMMGLRLLARSWHYAPHDQDTRLNVLRKTVAPNGAPDRAYDFNLPTLFRAGTPAGVDDPKPINLSLGVTFYTGQKTLTNAVSLFFREGPGDFTQQLDMNGLPQANFNGEPQPNYVSTSFRTRSQIELDLFKQTDLLGDSQTEIERTVDPDIRSYLTARVSWLSSNTTIQLLDSEGAGYSFSDVPPLAAETNYIFIVDIDGATIRGRIYPLDYSGNIKHRDLVFDTGIVIDENNYVRRRGRFGWYASLADGDAYVEGIRTRRQVYAELETAAFESITPVEGAELSLNATAPIEYVKELFPTDFKGQDALVQRDVDRSLSGISYRVENPGLSAPQGVQTNLIDFYDFNEMEMSFDIYYPASALEAGQTVSAYLSNDLGRIIPLHVGAVQPDRWFHVRISPNRSEAQTGRYRLNIVQTTPGPPSTWWVDNVSVTERVLSFYARSVREDPWGDAKIDWVPFRNAINGKSKAVQFIQRGNHLQAKGVAHRQSAQINSFKITPIYAHLGRFVWEEDELYNPQQPVADFTATADLLNVTFDGTTSHDPDGQIINYAWNFGDGTSAVGPTVTHTYRMQGVYYPSLTVTDSNGLQNRYEEELSVVAT